jgi:hypothetical protein
MRVLCRHGHPFLLKADPTAALSTTCPSMSIPVDYHCSDRDLFYRSEHAVSCPPDERSFNSMSLNRRTHFKTLSPENDNPAC